MVVFLKQSSVRPSIAIECCIPVSSPNHGIVFKHIHALGYSTFGGRYLPAASNYLCLSGVPKASFYVARIWLAGKM